jgi:hypothetical protein
MTHILHPSLLDPQSRHFRACRIAFRFSTLLVLFLLVGATAAFAANDVKSASKPCSVTELKVDGATDVQGFKDYTAVIADLLRQEKFDDLDCIADAARASKARFTGGMWKLYTIYAPLSDPYVGHATQEDWTNHLARLERWVAAKPQSITARVALADSYMGYAWDARGNETADTVSDTGWKLFAQRTAKARSVLEQASALPDKCPEWFRVMQDIGQAENWEPAQSQQLFERAVAFEPGYYYYYRVFANMLLPQWGGEVGDAERFIEESADRVGGTEGDILYYRVASNLVCPCPDVKMDHLSWPRLQKGFADIEKEYGESLLNTNTFAMVAVKAGDAVAADDAFKRIGDNWDRSTWRREENFRNYKSWAAENAEAVRRFLALRQEAAANLQTPEGQQYKKEFDQKFAPFVERCAKTTPSTEKTEFLINVGKDGSVERAGMSRFTPLAVCLMQELSQVRMNKGTPFPPPPHPSYLLALDLGPADVNTPAK